MAGKKVILFSAIKPFILFSGSSIDNATIGTAVGTATIQGKVTGTKSWSLTNSAGGKYAINSSTGAVTVAASLTAGTDTITIAVSGLTPAVVSKPFTITVASSASAALKFNAAGNSQYIGPII